MRARRESAKNGEEPFWYVYLVRCRDGTLYAGCAKDPVTRCAAHNAGRGAAYTRARTPVVLVHVEKVADRSAALRREAAIKRLTRREKLVMIAESRNNS